MIYVAARNFGYFMEFARANNIDPRIMKHLRHDSDGLGRGGFLIRLPHYEQGYGDNMPSILDQAVKSGIVEEINLAGAIFAKIRTLSGAVTSGAEAVNQGLFFMHAIHVIARSINQFDRWVKNRDIPKDVARVILEPEDLEGAEGFLLRLPNCDHDHSAEIKDLAKRLLDAGTLHEIIDDLSETSPAPRK